MFLAQDILQMSISFVNSLQYIWIQGIQTLFFSIGTHVDPQILIAKIEPGLVIPNLKHALATIMQDYRLQKDLQEACKKIVESDAYTLITRQEEMQKRGSNVTSGTTFFGEKIYSSKLQHNKKRPNTPIFSSEKKHLSVNV